MLKRPSKFGEIKSRPKEVQMKELRTALTLSMKGRIESEIPLDDVYWKIKSSLNKNG